MQQVYDTIDMKKENKYRSQFQMIDSFKQITDSYLSCLISDQAISTTTSLISTHYSDLFKQPNDKTSTVFDMKPSSNDIKHYSDRNKTDQLRVKYI
jgi:hypothetical protein